MTEAMLGGLRGQIRVCCVAMTGSARIAELIIRDLVTVDHYLALESDTLAALASGTAGGGGIGLIAGTGTVALALGRSGDQVILGGWGWLLGDEGGGFWIAMEALKATVRDVDGTGPHTTLTRDLPQILGQQDMREVYNFVTGQRLDRTAIAALTPHVVALAELGDRVAADILGNAATRLADLVVAMIAAAPFLDPDERIIVACGGVLDAQGRVFSRLAVELQHRAPGFELVAPAVPPVIGSYYLALKSAQIPVDDALQKRVAHQVRSLPALVSKRAPTAPTPSISNQLL
ncbi:N-acetylglucosamine kinase-like BadF-type ATPase [Frigoribacterium sp. CG_9.8]|nr:N-acetylglucosamine kinase-like BadF-type ATPase [Frigoribacterium sp. CG_9.8]